MITLFGATGYTGELVAQALAERGLPLRLGGRSATRLAALAARLPGQPATLVADAADPASLAALAEGHGSVLINCAGPFTDLGLPVAALAARRGLRYLDTTNELGFVQAIYNRLDGLARASGATLVPACAFEVALADCAAALLAARLLPGPLDELSVIYLLPGMGSSHGTRASALRSLATSWLAYRGGQLVAEHPGAAVRRFLHDGQTRHALRFPSSETATLPAHLAVRNVYTWMLVSPAAARYGRLVIPLGALLLRAGLDRVLRPLATRAAPPPPPARRVAMPWTILVMAQAGAQSYTCQLAGQDPYGLTAQIIAYAAARLLDGPAPTGVQPPARLLDPSTFLAALERYGVTVSFREGGLAPT